MPYGVLNFLDSGGLYGVLGGYLLGAVTVLLAVGIGHLLKGGWKAGRGK